MLQRTHQAECSCDIEVVNDKGYSGVGKLRIVGHGIALWGSLHT